ncbi:MAG: AbrB/MazE/SpoVT family DNA-binding domain-containing protein [Alphaproteobacteria bacterium]|nr:AbrB/MazE/SpoVT family DNA-binding domain-containing protein [Alphaproteobacteria bacterium]
MANRSNRVKVGPGGRIVLPAAQRRALGIAVGDEVVVRVDKGEIRVSSFERAIQRAQALVRRHVPKDVSLVDRLIQMRRAEAEE